MDQSTPGTPTAPVPPVRIAMATAAMPPIRPPMALVKPRRPVVRSPNDEQPATPAVEASSTQAVESGETYDTLETENPNLMTDEGREQWEDAQLAKLLPPRPEPPPLPRVSDTLRQEMKDYYAGLGKLSGETRIPRRQLAAFVDGKRRLQTPTIDTLCKTMRLVLVPQFKVKSEEQLQREAEKEERREAEFLAQVMGNSAA